MSEALQNNPVNEYLRMDRMPTIWCPGCGIGTTVNCFTRALTGCGKNLDKVAIVSGIGCSGRVAGYLNLDSFHTTHGRAIPFATGLKLAQPELDVVVYSGDGDLTAIGGNHLIHAARRNVNLSVFLVNNFIYGMTGGQVSPTTPLGTRTTTTPYRSLEYPFKIADIVAAAGASYVARWTTYHPFQLMESMQHAIRKQGFSFVEIISQCPVSFGKLVGMANPVDILRSYRDRSIPVEEAAGLSEQELEGRLVVGKLVERRRDELTQSLRSLNRERQEALRAELDHSTHRQDTTAMETGR